MNTRTWNNEEITLDELFIVFRRYMKDNNLSWKNQEDYRIGDYYLTPLTIRPGHGLSMWLQCIHPTYLFSKIENFANFMQFYNSTNLQRRLDEFINVLEETNLKEQYIYHLSYFIPNTDVNSMLKVLVCENDLDMIIAPFSVMNNGLDKTLKRAWIERVCSNRELISMPI